MKTLLTLLNIAVTAWLALEVGSAHKRLDNVNRRMNDQTLHTYSEPEAQLAMVVTRGTEQ